MFFVMRLNSWNPVNLYIKPFGHLPNVGVLTQGRV